MSCVRKRLNKRQQLDCVQFRECQSSPHVPQCISVLSAFLSKYTKSIFDSNTSNLMSLTDKKNRCKSESFKDFSVFFRQSLESMTGKPMESATEQDLCNEYENLQRKNKTQVLEHVAQLMELDRKQVLKHYSNCFTKCKYSALSKTVKQIIEIWMHNFITTQQQGKPLQLVHNFLKRNNIIRFPCSVQAYAQKTKEDLMRGRYRGPKYSEQLMKEYIQEAQKEEIFDMKMHDEQIASLVESLCGLTTGSKFKEEQSQTQESNVAVQQLNEQQDLINQLAMMLVSLKVDSNIGQESNIKTE